MLLFLSHHFFIFITFWLMCCQHLIALPEITSVLPTNGEIAGGNNVMISGSGFSGAVSVDFGQRPATTFNVINDFTISAIAPPGTPGTVDVKVTALGQSATSVNDFYTYTTEGWQGIISGTAIDQVAFFSTSTNTFDTLIPMANTSLASVITPDGTRIYTANTTAPGFSVIDAATNSIIMTVPTLVGPGAFDIVINPSGTRVYISNIVSGYVTVVDTTTNTVLVDILVEPNIGPLSVTPDGLTVFVSSFSSGMVFPIDTDSNSVGAGIVTGVFPGKTSITPDGQKAFIPVYTTDRVLVMNVATKTITNTILLPIGSGPYGSSLLPNSTALYVANIYNNTVAVIDVENETLTTIIDLPVMLMTFGPFKVQTPNGGAGSFWAAATPDSKTVYVISETNSFVYPIDTSTNTYGVLFDGVNSVFQDLVISPDPAPVASFIATVQAAGTPTIFDGSASLSPIGTIVSYAWDFGDGTHVTTTSPLIEHTYAIAGSYQVTLTVTNSAGTSTSKVFSSGFMSNSGGLTATISHVIQPTQAPPIHLRGIPKKCVFATQTNYVNVLTWKFPTLLGQPAYYEIFRDFPTNLIGTVKGNDPLIFRDQNRRKNKKYVYYVVAVSSLGVRSEPEVIIIKG